MSIIKRSLLISLFLFSALVFYQRCRKPSVSVLAISGQVKNEQTSALLANVEVSLKSRSLSSGTFNNNFQTIDSDSTDPSGNFNLEFENKSIAALQLTFEKEEHFLIEIELSPEDINLDSGLDLNILMNQVAEMNVNLVNQTPIDESDLIEFRYTNAGYSCGCCDNSVNIYQGIDVDTTLTCFVPLGVSLKYLSLITKNGAESIDTGTVVVSESVNNLELLY